MHIKDTIANHSQFDFGEEMYKEIHKQAHLKKKWEQHLLDNSMILEFSKEYIKNRKAPTRPTVNPITNIIIHRTTSYFLTSY